MLISVAPLAVIKLLFVLVGLFATRCLTWALNFRASLQLNKSTWARARVCVVSC